jgi:hypothetical protein
MPTVTTADGQVIDLDTGSVVGKETAPLAQSKWEIPSSPYDLAKQASYGFNAALFSLPDAAVRQIGKALGYDEKNVQTLTKIFNKGDTGAKNSEERYARAIGEGIGANLPVTGVLGYMAASQKLAAPLMADAGVLKRVAKETLDFIRKNPKAALAADITSGGAFGATRQYTEEAEMGPLAKELLPLGASIVAPIGGAAAAGIASKVAPSAIAAKYLKQVVSPSQEKLSEVGKEIASEYGPLTRPVANLLIPRAEKAVGKSLSKGEVQETLRKAEELITSLDAQGIKLNTAERTMLPQFLIEQGNLVKNMNPEQLQRELQRRSNNLTEFENIIERFSPKSNMQIDDAIAQVKLDSEELQNSLVQKIAQEKAVEADRVSGAYSAADRNILGNEIRDTILSSGEKTFFNLRNVADRMGLRANFTNEDGVPLPTREANGQSRYPSTNIEKPVNAILSKYNVLTGPIKEYTPYLATVLGRYKRGQQGKASTAFESELTKELTDLFVQRQRPGAGAPGPSSDYFAPSELAKDAASADLQFMQIQEGNARALVESLLRPPAGTKKRPGLGDLEPSQQTNLLARSYGIDPTELKAAMERAQGRAQKAGQIDINFPEAIELMQAATQSRNLAIQRFSDAQLAGRGREVAQKDLDKVNALYKDIEDMVFKAVPQMSREYKDFKEVYNNLYGDAYERYLPLIIGQKRPTGEFLVSNEAVLNEAFKNAKNLQDMKILLAGTKQGDDLLTRASMDWLRSKNILDKDGLVDPNKLQAVITNNKAIINAMPEVVKANINNDLAIGKAVSARIGQLEARRRAAADDELNKILAKSAREGADPTELITRVLRDPADMRVLVKSLEGQPERLEALRRAVYKEAADPSGQITISQFLDKANAKSLSYLFNPEQLSNLRKIGELERLIKASPEVANIPSPFESTSELLAKRLGTSLPGLTSLGRSVMEGRTGVTWPAAYVLTRFVGRQEYSILDRVMQRAVEDADFAKALVQQAQDKSVEGVSKRLQKFFNKSGVYVPEIVYNAPRRAVMVDTAQALQEEPVVEEPVAAPAVQPPAPPAPRPTAPVQPTAQKQMQNFNQRFPAPPTKGVPTLKPALPTTPPAPSGNAAAMYQSLFPQDTIGQAIQLNKQPPQQ